MLISNKEESWGQTVSRFLDADGLLVGLTFTPQMREKYWDHRKSLDRQRGT